MLDGNMVTESALIAMSFSQQKVENEHDTSNKHMKKDGSIIKPPAFSHVYNLKTVPQSNSKGEFYNWSITKVGPLTDQMLTKLQKNSQRVSLRVQLVLSMMRIKSMNHI